MDLEARLQRILRTLDRARSETEGRRRDIDQKLGHTPGYLSRVCNGRISLDVRTLLRAVELLGLDPEAFLRRAFGITGRPDVERQLAAIEAREPGSGPPLLDRIAELAATARPEAPRPPCVDAAELRERLRRLDELRFVDAMRAEADLLPVLERSVASAERKRDPASRLILCRSLAVAGSTFRVRSRFPTAARCFRLGFNALGSISADPATRADLLQRSSYLFADDGASEIAGQIALDAVEAYLLAHDIEATGKALVTRATILGNEGHERSAIQIYTSSLHYLAADDWRYRFSVYQGLARMHFGLGELGEAAGNVEKAKSIHKTRQGWSWAKLIWLEGEIAFEDGDFEAAEAALQMAREAILHTGEPLDSILISLTLTKVLIKLNRRSEIGRLADWMMGLSAQLRGNKIAKAAVNRFISAVLRGELTVACADAIQRKIEKVGARGCGRPGEG